MENYNNGEKILRQQLALLAEASKEEGCHRLEQYSLAMCEIFRLLYSKEIHSELLSK